MKPHHQPASLLLAATLLVAPDSSRGQTPTEAVADEEADRILIKNVFIIDSRESVDDLRVNILLDTSTHVRFAMKDGVIVRNKLLNLRTVPGNAEAKRSGWTSYTPPPMAVPPDANSKSKTLFWKKTIYSPKDHI